MAGHIRGQHELHRWDSLVCLLVLRDNNVDVLSRQHIEELVFGILSESVVRILSEVKATFVP